jgi:hypothetical protein
VEILLAERNIEAVGVSSGLNVGGGGSFSKHLQDWIAGNQVNEEEY